MDIFVTIEFNRNGLEEMGKLFSGWLRESVDIEVAEPKIRVRIELGSIVFRIFEETPFDADSEGRDLTGVKVKRVFIKGTVGILPGLIFGGVGNEDAEGFVVLSMSHTVST